MDHIKMATNIISWMCIFLSFWYIYFAYIYICIWGVPYPPDTEVNLIFWKLRNYKTLIYFGSFEKSSGVTTNVYNYHVMWSWDSNKPSWSGFVFSICEVGEVQSSTRGLGQIWLQAKLESRKVQAIGYS